MTDRRRARDHDPPDPGVAPERVLARRVAHDMNNIAAVLGGFLELGRESVGDPERLDRCFAELTAGIAGLSGLAAELAVLAEGPGAPARLDLLDLIPPGLVARRPERRAARNRESLAAVADAGLASQALGALHRIMLASVSPVRTTIARVTVQGGGRCAACGADVPRGPAVIAAPVAPQWIAAEALARPLHLRRSGAGARATTLAAMIHAAHASGGHVLANTEAASLGIAWRGAN